MIDTTINDNNLYISNNSLSKYYNEFLHLLNKNIGIDNSKTNNEKNNEKNNYIQEYNIITYPYLLVSHYLYYKFDNTTETIAKYKPFSIDFFIINELFIKYNLFKILNKLEDTVLYIGNSLGLNEYISYHKYNFTGITNILTLQQNYFSDLLTEWNTYIKNISSIYNINNIKYDDTIYNINKSLSTIATNNKIIYWDVYRQLSGLSNYNSYYNIPLYITGIIFSLTHLAKTGTLIFNIESVAYKHTADIVLIIAQYFEKWDLFYPELHNRYKRNGTVVVFTNFNGITPKDLTYLEKLLEEVKMIYPNEAKDFNIYDPILRKTLLHLYSIDIPDKPLPNIISFLKYNIDDKIYNPFRFFNDTRYTEQLLYASKMINILNNPTVRTKYLNTKLPTDEQITTSLLYCKKYDIPYFDKYNTTKLTNAVSKNILSEMYGLHEPILFKFKLYSQHKMHLSIRTKHKSNSSIGTVMRNILSYQKTKKNSVLIKTKKNSVLIKTNYSLLELIFPMNNQLIQVGRLIDSRRDFTKSNTNEQTWLYDTLKHQLRYYKSIGRDSNLDIMVQEYLGDKSISQAWLKMYEIITECNLVSQTQTGHFRSFHLCEAPGTFINALNNYIRTKTQYSEFDWFAQSLNPKIAKIKDTYGLIKRHHTRWDWGVDNTGDITNVQNIRYYKKQVESREAIQLVTSDCGLEWGNQKYELVAFASYVAILNILPIGGTMLYKILAPIDLPLLWNLIYITYTNFKEMYFFKPVQNSQSREFYIIAKQYKGTDSKMLDKLLNIIQRWNKLESNNYKAQWIEKLDLFNDKYPEEFITQVVNILERLTTNYTNSIERIIYYMDNNKYISDKYKSYIGKYVNEKNKDWIAKYKPLKLNNKFIL